MYKSITSWINLLIYPTSEIFMRNKLNCVQLLRVRSRIKWTLLFASLLCKSYWIGGFRAPKVMIFFLAVLTDKYGFLDALKSLKWSYLFLTNKNKFLLLSRLGGYSLKVKTYYASGFDVFLSGWCLSWNVLILVSTIILTGHYRVIKLNDD